MNSHAVVSYLTSRQWAMDPAQLQALAETIAVAIEKIPVDTLRAAQEESERQAIEAAGGPMRQRAGDDSQARKPYDLRDGVAHIRVEGPILKELPCIFGLLGIRATSTIATQRAISAAVEDEDVASLSIDIDSPGGSLAGVQELADDVHAAAGLKPTVAHVSDFCASAAYWIGSQASKITANESALVGSIGVYSVMVDESAADAAAGIKVHVLRSAPLKGAAGGDGLTTAQLADAQRIVDEAAALFTAAVARGRGISIEDAQKVSTGQVWFASEALQRGLIDGISSAAGAHATLAQPNPLPVVIKHNAPGVGASQEINTMTLDKNVQPQADAESVEKLKADLAAANARNAALEANAKALEDERKEALLGQYRDRIAPSALGGFQAAAATMTPEALESWLKQLPPVTHAERVASAGAQVIAQAISKEAPSVAEVSLARQFGQSIERCRDMQALGEAVERVEYERTTDASGKVVMEPIAVMKDGSRASRKELKSRLGLTGALAAVAFVVASLFAGQAHAALSAARATDCKSFGSVTKAYLMKASTTIYAGGMVMIDSNGVALPAAASASNHNVVGVAQQTKTSAASGSYWINVTDRALCLFAATTIAQTNVGQIMYAEDDETVDETQSANEPIAGILLQYVSASSGWVYISSAFTQRVALSATDPLSLTGDLTLAGGAGALTLTDSASSVVVPDNDASALDIGSTGLLDGMRVATTNGAEFVLFKFGVGHEAIDATDDVTLDASDCGKHIFATADMDTKTITLPALAAVPDGCEFHIHYTGADGGALLDISPNAADGIEGSCTLAASVVELSGTDDADIGLTKATIKKGDVISLVSGDADDWYAYGIQGICANN